MPEEGEGTAVLATLVLQPFGAGEGLFMGQAHVVLSEKAPFHDDQWPFDERQYLALLQVEDGEFVAGAATEPGAVSVTQGAVVIQAGLRPVAPGDRRLPTQEMLPAAPGALMNALTFTDLEQAFELPPGTNSVPVGLVTGMEAYFMAPFVDLPQHPAEVGVIDGIVAVELWGRAGSLEIEGALEPMLFADVHDPVKGVVGVPFEVPPLRRRPVAEPPESPSGVLTLEDIPTEGAQDPRWRRKSLRKGRVHVVGQNHPKLTRFSLKAGPEPLHAPP